jgi:MscS family membrane protein
MNDAAWLKQIAESLAVEGWVIQIFVIVLLTAILNYSLKILISRLRKRTATTANVWDEAFFNALKRPLSVLIWVLGICFAGQIVYQQTEAAIFQAVGPIQSVTVIVMLAWFLVRFIANTKAAVIEKNLAADPSYDRTTADAIGKLLRLSVLITAALVVLQTLGFSISGVLAFGGIGGLAIGFAAKDLLANFFGGLMIYLDRPFNVGDWIRSPDREIEGTVEEIGWRLTRIRTFDKRPLYVPNGVFANIALENPSRMQNRRIYETVGVRYEDAGKMAAITGDVKKMLQEHAEIDQTGALIVNFNKFAPSSLDFFIYAMTKTTDWFHYHEVKEDVLLKVLDIIAGHGAECAFPTSTVHLADAAG